MPNQLPEIEKTRLMKLIEASDPLNRDIRLIAKEAYERSGGYEGTAQYIRETYGEPVTISTLHCWFDEWGWSVQRTLVTPGIPDSAALAGAA